MWDEFWLQVALCLGAIVLAIWLVDGWHRPGCSGDCSQGDEACNCGEEN